MRLVDESYTSFVKGVSLTAKKFGQMVSSIDKAGKIWGELFYILLKS